MGLLTDLWNQISEFLGIEAVEPIVPEAPPKPLEPVDVETPLPEITEPIVPIEEIEPLPILDIIEPTTIGEQGRADRIEVLPAKEPTRVVVSTKKTYLYSTQIYEYYWITETVQYSDARGLCKEGGQTMERRPVRTPPHDWERTKEEWIAMGSPRI